MKQSPRLCVADRGTLARSRPSSIPDQSQRCEHDCIVEEEQHGCARAECGTDLISKLTIDLQARFGRGYSRPNLFKMRASYLGHREILSTPSRQSSPIDRLEIVSTASRQFLAPEELALVASQLRLPWSCYGRLLSVRNPEAQRFHEGEALRGGWTVRQLDRQIGTQFYERTVLSKNKAAMLRKCQQQTPDDVVTPEEEIKDPFFFEFLNLKDEYSETDLEGALIAKLETFLLELGGDFTFVGRQRRGCASATRGTGSICCSSTGACVAS